LVKVYIEDAIGERIWVDHPDCKGFVENICTAFDTKMPTSNIFFATGTGSKATVGEGGISGRESPGVQGSGSRSGSGSATPTRPGTDDDSQVWILLISSFKKNRIFKLGYIFSKGRFDLELLCVDARMLAHSFIFRGCSRRRKLFFCIIFHLVVVGMKIKSSTYHTSLFPHHTI
jgi:hypothetical protein